jgi:hypothetical protein
LGYRLWILSTRGPFRSPAIPTIWRSRPVQNYQWKLDAHSVRAFSFFCYFCSFVKKGSRTTFKFRKPCRRMAKSSVRIWWLELFPVIQR